MPCASSSSFRSSARLPAPRRLAASRWRIEVGDDRARRRAVLERGGIDKRLEGGAGLALRRHGAIEAALAEAAAADQREHLAGARIGGEQRPLHVIGRALLRAPSFNNGAARLVTEPGTRFDPIELFLDV